MMKYEHFQLIHSLLEASELLGWVIGHGRITVERVVRRVLVENEGVIISAPAPVPLPARHVHVYVGAKRVAVVCEAYHGHPRSVGS